MDKYCAGCNRWKFAFEFGRDPKGWLRARCELCVSANSRRWHAAHQEQRRAYDAQPARRAKRRERNRAWRHAHAADPQYVTAQRLRRRLREALTRARASKGARTFVLVGCSPAELVAHLERQFLPGMSWANRSEWHIDHIKPLAAFDLTDPQQQRECCHWTNLRPLWASDNFRKGASEE